jgi:putative oxidoreductase
VSEDVHTITRVETTIQTWLTRNSVRLLRISMGAVILGFGFLKYFPGVSPAEHMVETVSRTLTFGLMPDRPTMFLFATVECLIGLSLITGIGLRVVIYPTGLWAVGILSPLVLMPGELFSGPDHMPSLEGQYVLKDVILLTATLVIAEATAHSRQYGASGRWD